MGRNASNAGKTLMLAILAFATWRHWKHPGIYASMAMCAYGSSQELQWDMHCTTAVTAEAVVPKQMWLPLHWAL